QLRRRRSSASPASARPHTGALPAAATTLSVTVGKGTPVVDPLPPEGDEGGCSAAGSAPVWGLALAGLALLRRRRS
ncbi:MAG: hypothetical protein EOO72_10680, partial [Myxococcaceae bacterium]